MDKLYTIYKEESNNENNYRHNKSHSPEPLKEKYTLLTHFIDSFVRLIDYHSLLKDIKVAKIMEEVGCEMGLLI